MNDGKRQDIRHLIMLLVFATSRLDVVSDNCSPATSEQEITHRPSL